MSLSSNGWFIWPAAPPSFNNSNTIDSPKDLGSGSGCGILNLAADLPLINKSPFLLKLIVFTTTFLFLNLPIIIVSPILIGMFISSLNVVGFNTSPLLESTESFAPK